LHESFANKRNIKETNTTRAVELWQATTNGTFLQKHFQHVKKSEIKSIYERFYRFTRIFISFPSLRRFIDRLFFSAGDLRVIYVIPK
jgi:hypothetical protein